MDSQLLIKCAAAGYATQLAAFNLDTDQVTALTHKYITQQLTKAAALREDAYNRIVGLLQQLHARRGR